MSVIIQINYGRGGGIFIDSTIIDMQVFLTVSLVYFVQMGMPCDQKSSQQTIPRSLERR